MSLMQSSLGFGVLACCACGVHAQTLSYSNTLGTPGFNGSYVAAFVVHDDGTGESLYATGSFQAAGVAGGGLIARWDGSSWQSVGGGLQNQYSSTLASFQGDLIVGGYFDTAGGVSGSAKLARWDGTNWNSMNAQSEIFLNSIWDLEVHDDGTGEQLYIAGNYGDLAGDPALDHIARWDGANYSAVGGTIGGAGIPLIVLDIHSTDLGGGPTLYAAGRFLTIGGTAALNIGAWDGAGWNALGLGLTRTSGIAQVFHMTTFDDGNGPALYVGGSFNLAGGQPVANVAKWDGTSWSAVGDGFDSAVQELIVFDDGSGDALYALGNFSNSGATPAAHIAKWNGTSWEAVGSGTDANLFGAIVYDIGEGESLIIGGSITQADCTMSNRVASINARSCVPDFVTDGVLNFFDVQSFLGAFVGQCHSADLVDDDTWDFFDVQAFLQAFAAGCE